MTIVDGGVRRRALHLVVGGVSQIEGTQRMGIEMNNEQVHEVR